MDENLKSKIEGLGHWRVNIRPLQQSPVERSLGDCLNAVIQSRVSLRGWDYPHYNENPNHGGTEYVGEYVENWCDWFVHAEFWRMYRSSQFIHYKALTEDIDTSGSNRPQGRVLSVLGAIYSITEMVEFTSRLHRNGFYADGARLSITLRPTEGRQLWISDPRRLPFFNEKKTDAPFIEIIEAISPDQLSNSGRDVSLKMILKLFDHFGWNPEPSQIRSDQNKFYNREW